MSGWQCRIRGTVDQQLSCFERVFKVEEDGNKPSLEGAEIVHCPTGERYHLYKLQGLKPVQPCVPHVGIK